jgi:hypothetical protein
MRGVHARKPVCCATAKGPDAGAIETGREFALVDRNGTTDRISVK